MCCNPMLYHILYDYPYYILCSNRFYTPEVLLQRERQDKSYYPIASLHFCELKSLVNSSGKTDRRIRLFVTMNTSKALDNEMTGGGAGMIDDGSYSSLMRGLDTAGIICFDCSLSGNNHTNSMSNITPANRRNPVILDDMFGVQSASCATFMKDTMELVVTRPEGVFSFSPDDRGGAAGIEGTKQCVCAIGRYVLVATTDVDKYNPNNIRTSVTVYDLRSKFISFYYQLPIGDKVSHCLQDGSKCNPSYLCAYVEVDLCSIYILSCIP